jgi:hypothetical protein
MKKLLFTILFLLFAGSVYAQNINQIKGKCPNTIGGYGFLIVQGNGDINAVPCAGKNFLINGSPITGTVTGTGTANYISRWTSASAIGNTPFSWNNTQYEFNNTALNSEFELLFTPSTAAGRLLIGDCTTTPTNCLDLNQSTGILNIATASNTGVVTGGSFTVSNDINFDVISGGNVSYTTIAGDVIFDLSNSNNNFQVNTGTGATTFTTDSFRISNSFAVSTASNCAGKASLDGSGLATVTINNCTITNDSVIIVVYNANDARVIPLTAVRATGTTFNVVGDADAPFAYWIINRY